MPSKIISPAQSRGGRDEPGSTMSSVIKDQKEKSVTRLAHNGLRIIQTNNLASTDRHNATH